jgi:hypothetical protein
MDSLIIQDAFDPYYCDRKPFAVSKSRKRWIKSTSGNSDGAGSRPSVSPKGETETSADGDAVTGG